MRTQCLLVFCTFFIVVDATHAAGDGTPAYRDAEWPKVEACFADAQSSDDPGIVEGAELQCEAMLRSIAKVCDDGTSRGKAERSNLIERSHDD
ncbi:hypothetical protein [Paraburkholderia sp. 2C]